MIDSVHNLQKRRGPLTLKDYQRLMDFNIGYRLALRDLGLKVGDARYNDAAIEGMEIMRYARECLQKDLKGWEGFERASQ
jgi:hypothetical protein